MQRKGLQWLSRVAILTHMEKQFNLQPELVGDMIALYPLQEIHFEKLYMVASDPLIWEQHPEPTRYQRDVFMNFFRGAMESCGAFIVVDKDTNEIIGSSRFYNADYEKSQITIGYTFLGRKYWGGRFNRELKTLMLTHAFTFFNRVRFEIGENNLRSRRAIGKIGAQLVERQALDGKVHCVYEVSR